MGAHPVAIEAAGAPLLVEGHAAAGADPVAEVRPPLAGVHAAAVDDARGLVGDDAEGKAAHRAPTLVVVWIVGSTVGAPRSRSRTHRGESGSSIASARAIALVSSADVHA